MSDIYNLFNIEIKSLDLEKINRDIEEKGFYCFEKILNDQAISRMESDATNSKININTNEISGVYFETQYHFTNLLSSSKTFYDFITSKFTVNICKNFLGNFFRIKALRYYETFTNHNTQWHTDNKTDKNFAKIKGLIFLIYISDVDDGQFQYIEGSHTWSGKNNYSDYDEKFINSNYKNKIKDFKLPKGSIIVYNSYGIHRAKPVFKSNFVRKSVFCQIDANLDDSEPIILNSKFLNKIDSDTSMILGFGKPSNYKIYPKTSLNTLPFNKNILSKILLYLVFRFLRGSYNLMPAILKKRIKKIIKF